MSKYTCLLLLVLAASDVVVAVSPIIISECLVDRSLQLFL